MNSNYPDLKELSKLHLIWALREFLGLLLIPMLDVKQTLLGPVYECIPEGSLKIYQMPFYT